MQQVEIDTEKHILTQTKKLSDGSYEKIFSRNPRGQSGFFSYNCHLCGVLNLPGEKGLQTHITGKKHQNRLVFNYVPEADQFRSYIGLGGKNVQTIFPGEPIPPGFEDEMKPTCYMEETMAKIDKPLIGMEYVIELHDIKAKEPLYVCTLCDKRCDPRNIIPQITSHRHRMKYLDIHFPSLMKILNPLKRFNIDMNYREDILTKVAKAIEEKSKRQKPMVCEYKKYEVNKTEINDDIKKSKHFDEKDFPDCDKILNLSVKATDLDDVSSSDSEFAEYSESRKISTSSDKKMNSKKFEDARYVKESSYVRNKDLSIKNFIGLPPLRQSSTEIPKRILTPRELSEQSEAKMLEKYNIVKYKTLVERGMQELEKKHKEYIKNPEKHPMYSDEWKAFWSRRYKELIAQGKDANSYNYKPEWITFWMKRMIELHEEDKKDKKNEIRRKLKLTVEFVNKIEMEPEKARSPSKSPVRKISRSPIRRRSRSHSPPFRRSRQSRSPIEISDESDDDNYRRPSTRHKRMRYEDERSRSRFSESPMSYHSTSNYRRSPSPDNSEINLVSVCRLLSALESELGILANRVIELLTKAVAMEKSQANSCDTLLYDDENMILMETAKERLKGGLSAGLVPSNRVPPVKKAIQQIASLIHEANKKKPKKQELPDPTEAARLEIARVLTEALLEQGKDDISAEELEEMITEFMQEGLEQIKEESAATEAEPEKKEVKPSEVEVEAEEPKKPQETKEENFSELENLTDDDLKTLLRNFSDLTSEEQNHLITYLSKIENSDRQRVERLRKYVDIGDEDIESESEHEAIEPIVEHEKVSIQEKSQIISDDEYEDTEIVKSMNAQINNEPKSSSALANTGAVANELMSSLMTSFMQNSQPQQDMSWDMPVETDPMQYQMMMQSNYYNPSLPMQSMSNTMAPWQQPPMPEMPLMINQFAPVNQPPPPTQRIDSNIARQRHVQEDHLPYRKRLERPNNTQLTGKGKHRR